MWIGVEPGLRRHGVGSQLIRRIEAEALRGCCTMLEVSTVADIVSYKSCAETRAFYKAVGFQEVRVDRGYYATGDDRLLVREPSRKES